MVAANPLLQAQPAGACWQITLAPPGACQGFLPRLPQAHQSEATPGKLGDHPEGLDELVQRRRLQGEAPTGSRDILAEWPGSGPSQLAAGQRIRS